MKLKEKLNRIRMPRKRTRGMAVVCTLCCLAAGVVLGIGSKWLDNLALDSAVWWHRGIEALDLGNFFSELAIWLLLALLIAVFSPSACWAALNVFAFFTGMCGAYHLCTILFSGFHPGSYMTIWYAITLASPFLAILCWYAKGSGWAAVLLNIGIYAVFALACFAMGWFYVDWKGILYLVTFVGAALGLYRGPKRLLLTLPVGFLLALLLSPIWPFR